ncbi:2-succinyl-5-enolpyruvyl-6-hydroxy-3-cyclohexene-1-carboxylic-acid synthase [Lentibacillus sediminis]|uniref:2-succinyl-5-enolpyruvyl-6-hydroxy-3- cyclohexene-1-carboxylic-acid synthase n=1 Tax=Lentibacillus sediminis TaxID=1940529 RepID=UPI000C1C2C9C|nr:2-succinyl-5-enolpyruvyl-6-hydroxy-3-cyclohexene-1-carboxylic-acid synthase [Lentibacillus sediminis]
MSHTEALTRYTANFTDELVQSGVTDAVISPGSRSTPMALMMTEHPDLKEWVILDERSAAFFALGLAKASNRPVALLCTSGTAAANYFPAIVEAAHSRVPLVVLTADRPHELRDVGAPQAIDQIKLYGDYVKWFHEMALPESTPQMLEYARSKAVRAVYMAGEGNPGPVHVNLPFREPLNPDFSLPDLWSTPATSGSRHPVLDGMKQLPDRETERLFQQLQGKEKGLIVCGPQPDEKLADAITRFAAVWGLPILADPLSQLRGGGHAKDHIIESYDAILRSQDIRGKLQPDFIIRFGAMPVSKPYLFYVKEHRSIPHYVVEADTGFREPTGSAVSYIFADPASLCAGLSDTPGKETGDWLRSWQEMNKIAVGHLQKENEPALTEGSAVREMLEVTPDESTVYVGNSMAVRDLDSFFLTSDKHIPVLANRGTNGIDGMISSGLGAAAAGKRVILLLGDLSFFHDMNGLLAAKHYQLPITILLINNNGGGIFSFLPHLQGNQHFEKLFGTPVDIEFKQAVEMYGGTHTLAKNAAELKQAMQETAGLSVIEVQTDREENVRWHREKWKAIEQDLLSMEV